MNYAELSLRNGFAIDRAEQCLAHAIAIVNGDWSEAKTLARSVREDAFMAGLKAGHKDTSLALSIIGYLDNSRDRLPV